jgi:hypothetical protein
VSTRTRRSAAVLAVAAFVVLVVLSAVVSGSRPGSGQGTAPAVLAGCSYACLLVAALLLLVPPRRSGDAPTGAGLLAMAVVLAGLDLAIEDGSPDIGGGLLRLVCLGVVVALTVRLAGTVAADRRR